MGDIMKVLEKQLRDVRRQHNVKERLKLPPVRPNAVGAARRRADGALNSARRNEASHVGLPPLPVPVVVDIDEMKHGVVNMYREPEEPPLVVPKPVPIWFEPTMRNGRQVDRQSWFAHPE